METATRRRLSDELNIEAELEHIYWFCYTAEFDETGSENELCHVYLGRLDGRMQPNDSEISATRFVAAGDVTTELDNHPERYTPWFQQEWRTLTDQYSERLAKYCDPT
jgi:isopentenyl-diphosphate delta-isomerase